MNVYGLTPGETYYVQLAAKTASATGKYKLKVSPTIAPDPPANNWCATAGSVGTGDTPFSLSRATMDCPMEPLLPRLKNDIWNNFLAFDPGLYEVTTCPSAGAGPGTTLAVYSGEGECPVDTDRRRAANDDAGGDCDGGSRLFFSHTGMPAVYRVRLGGEDGSEPTGQLKIAKMTDCNGNLIPDECDVSCGDPGSRCDTLAGCGGSSDGNGNGVPDECESCPDGESIVFSSPPDGFYDARQPYPVHDAASPQGMQAFEVTTVDTCCSPDCWSVTDPSNGIAGASESGGVCTITLNNPLSHDGVTELVYTSGSGSTTVTGTFTYMPGDVDMSGACGVSDIQALIDSLNGTTPLPPERADINRDGDEGPADLLRLIDLINGAGDYDPC
jgi:hypothetical protein